MNNAPTKLAQSLVASLIAPAGAGKTEVIVDSVALTKGKELVLTHTHAGLQSLKSRFKKKNIDSKLYRIETIAGFSLRFASAYPILSKLDKNRTTLTLTDWSHVYQSMGILLKKKVLKEVMLASYTGVYVDEYQDCTLEQHELIKSVSELLPCRVLGDPLQGIFDFGTNKLVDWKTDVVPHFPPIEVSPAPRRWEKYNIQLGQWLMDIRQKLISGQNIDLSKLPPGVIWHQSSTNPMTLIKLCKYDMPKDEGTRLIIRTIPNLCHSLAKKLGGFYKSMEEFDSTDIKKWISKIDESPTGIDLCILILELSKISVTKFSPISTFLSKTKSGGIYKSRKFPEISSLIEKMRGEKNYDDVVSLMVLCEEALGRKNFHRTELWIEIKRALANFVKGSAESLVQSAFLTRNQTRILGRQNQKRVVSRTLLVKGLEFDHVVVVDADKMNAKNLYVSLTRARQTLHIWSDSTTLRFRA